MSQLRSSLALSTSIDYDAIKRNAYRDQRVLVVKLDDPRLSWADREILNRIGDRLYGKAGPGR